MNYSDYNQSFSNKKDGIPKFPLFGYDCSEDLDSDMVYMKSIYPPSVRRILKEVEDQCDKLEYDGSCMFDDIPDPVHLGTLVDHIYETVMNLEPPIAPLRAENLNPAFCSCGSGIRRPCPPPPPMPWPESCPSGRHCPPSSRPWPESETCRSGRHCPIPPRSDFKDGDPDWLRGVITSLLFNEMIHRRRRYRCRKQWV